MNVKFALINSGKLIACSQHEYFSFVNDLEYRNIPNYSSYLGDLLATYIEINGNCLLVALQWGGDCDLN